MTTEPDNLTRKMDETLNRVAEDMHDLKERFSRFETRQAATEIVISGIHARLGTSTPTSNCGECLLPPNIGLVGRRYPCLLGNGSQRSCIVSL